MSTFKLTIEQCTALSMIGRCNQGQALTPGYFVDFTTSAGTHFYVQVQSVNLDPQQPDSVLVTMVPVLGNPDGPIQDAQQISPSEFLKIQQQSHGVTIPFLWNGVTLDLGQSDSVVAVKALDHTLSQTLAQSFVNADTPVIIIDPVGMSDETHPVKKVCLSQDVGLSIHAIGSKHFVDLAILNLPIPLQPEAAFLLTEATRITKNFITLQDCKDFIRYQENHLSELLIQELETLGEMGLFADTPEAALHTNSFQSTLHIDLSQLSVKWVAKAYKILVQILSEVPLSSQHRIFLIEPERILESVREFCVTTPAHVFLISTKPELWQDLASETWEENRVVDQHQLAISGKTTYGLAMNFSLTPADEPETIELVSDVSNTAVSEAETADHALVTESDEPLPTFEDIAFIAEEDAPILEAAAEDVFTEDEAGLKAFETTALEPLEGLMELETPEELFNSLVADLPNLQAEIISEASTIPSASEEFEETTELEKPFITTILEETSDAIDLEAAIDPIAPIETTLSEMEPESVDAPPEALSTTIDIPSENLEALAYLQQFAEQEALTPPDLDPPSASEDTLLPPEPFHMSDLPALEALSETTTEAKPDPASETLEELLASNQALSEMWEELLATNQTLSQDSPIEEDVLPLAAEISAEEALPVFTLDEKTLIDAAPPPAPMPTASTDSKTLFKNTDSIVDEAVLDLPKLEPHSSLGHFAETAAISPLEPFIEELPLEAPTEEATFATSAPLPFQQAEREAVEHITEITALTTDSSPPATDDPFLETLAFNFSDIDELESELLQEASSSITSDEIPLAKPSSDPLDFIFAPDSTELDFGISTSDSSEFEEAQPVSHLNLFPETEIPLFSLDIDERTGLPPAETPVNGSCDGSAPIPIHKIPVEPTLSDFNPGQMVFHPRYGRGIIQRVIPMDQDQIILNIHFDGVGKRLLDPKLTQLEKVS